MNALRIAKNCPKGKWSDGTGCYPKSEFVENGGKRIRRGSGTSEGSADEQLTEQSTEQPTEDTAVAQQESPQSTDTSGSYPTTMSYPSTGDKAKDKKIREKAKDSIAFQVIKEFGGDAVKYFTAQAKKRFKDGIPCPFKGTGVKGAANLCDIWDIPNKVMRTVYSGMGRTYQSVVGHYTAKTQGSDDAVKYTQDLEYKQIGEEGHMTAADMATILSTVGGELKAMRGTHGKETLNNPQTAKQKRAKAKYDMLTQYQKDMTDNYEKEKARALSEANRKKEDSSTQSTNTSSSPSESKPKKKRTPRPEDITNTVNYLRQKDPDSIVNFRGKTIKVRDALEVLEGHVDKSLKKKKKRKIRPEDTPPGQDCPNGYHRNAKTGMCEQVRDVGTAEPDDAPAKEPKSSDGNKKPKGKKQQLSQYNVATTLAALSEKNPNETVLIQGNKVKVSVAIAVLERHVQDIETSEGSGQDDSKITSKEYKQRIKDMDDVDALSELDMKKIPSKVYKSYGFSHSDKKYMALSKEQRFLEKETDDENGSLYLYTGTGAEGINAVMNGKDRKKNIKMYPKTHHHVVELDSLLSKTIIDEPIIAYKGLDFKSLFPNFNENTIGSVEPIRTYFSTSVSKKVGQKFAEPRGYSLIEIHVPSGEGIGLFTGLRGVEKYQNQQELLLKRKSVFELISINANAKKNEVMAVVELVR